MKNKFLSIVLVFLSLTIGIFSGCESGYNAELFSQSNDWVQPDFFEKNKVQGAYYLNPDYDANKALTDPNYAEQEYYWELLSPASRTFIITEENNFKKVFTKDSTTINFDEQILILYMFADSYPQREYILKSLYIENGVLNIEVELEDKGEVGDATMPYQRCLIVKMDRTRFAKVEFVVE